MLDDDDNQSLFKNYLEHSIHHSPLDDTTFPPPDAEVDPLEILPCDGSDWNGDWEIGEDLDDTLGGLELNSNDGLSNSEIYDNRFGTANNTGTDADPSQCVTETVNTLWSPEIADSRISEFQEYFLLLSTVFLTLAQLECTPPILPPK